MTHAFTTPDPIHAAIARHRAAYDAYQVAPEGIASIEANDEYDAASDALVSTPCATRFGALALVGHLRWWLTEEADFKDGHQPAYGLAVARAADLVLFLGTPLPPSVIPPETRPLPMVDLRRWDSVAALRDESLPGEDEPWRAVAAIRPDTAYVRAPRFLDVAGELLAAVAIIGGGMVITGFATLL